MLGGGVNDTLELGTVDGPVLVCGGAYGNRQATEAMLAVARERGIPGPRIIHTGDLIAYCADPAATVARFRDAGAHCLLGNVEAQIAADAVDCNCGFAPDTACDAMAAQWYRFNRTAISAADRTWLGARPRRIAFTQAGRRLTVVHGAPSAVNRFVFPSTPEADKAAEIANTDADGVIAGHSGIPFSQIIDGRLWHNSGAVGLPAHDGTPRTWYAILTPENGAIRIAHHALTYDAGGAARAIRTAGLAEGYAAALETGFWPSCDVLPDAERARAGRPLPEQRLLWLAQAARAA